MAKHVVKRVHVLVAPFEGGPRRVRVEDDGGRQLLVLDAVGEVVKYALVVVDEAHHLVGDTELHGQLEAINAKVWDLATGKCVATLEGHSNDVRRAASALCTTFVICRRCRSGALRCPRTSGASFLGRTTRRSSFGGYPELSSRGHALKRATWWQGRNKT